MHVFRPPMIHPRGCLSLIRRAVGLEKKSARPEWESRLSADLVVEPVRMFERAGRGNLREFIDT